MRPDSPLPGIGLLLILTLAVLMLAFCAYGCAEMPITLSAHGDYGKVSYSAKAGIEITVEK